MRAIDWAYTAGVIDGEGCIGVYRNNRGAYIVRIDVHNTNSELIHWLNDTHGGCISVYSHWKKRLNCKPEYSWYLTGYSTYQFLKSIYPYLIVKKLVAEVAMQFYEGRKKWQRLMGSDRAKAEALYIETKRLNKRGQI